MERQIDRYNELWMAYDNLLTEAQALRSQVTILSSGERAEGASGWFEGVSGRAGGANHQSDGPNDRAGGGNCHSRG